MHGVKVVQRLLITKVALMSRTELVDVRCEGGRICEVGRDLVVAPNERLIAGNGGALLPGLHDHHIHLFALAALCNSVQCGPPEVSSRSALLSALRYAPGSGWIRGVNYHESVMGDLDLHTLDRICPDRPIKIQHRSGKMWMVNSLAAEQLSLHQQIGMRGIELDHKGCPSGRLYRLDGWMRRQLNAAGPATVPSLIEVSQRLAGFGVTGVTDTSPDNGHFAMSQFSAAAERGELLQRVRVMGGEDLPRSSCEQVQRGERKVMLDENALPDWDSLRAIFSHAHSQARAVAVHCVTSAELVLALAVLRNVGVHSGDRIEHASMVPAQLIPLVKQVGVRVVTQPGFIYERGDQYLEDIPHLEQNNLYRCKTLLAQGIRVAGSTDAPYGDPDPWDAMRAAVNRRSRSGSAIGPAEALSPEQALALFTSAADDAGGAVRRVEEGCVADLCLLNQPWKDARLRLRSDDVIASFRNGKCIFHRDGTEKQGTRDASAAA